jgi:hypothetical protein
MRNINLSGPIELGSVVMPIGFNGDFDYNQIGIIGWELETQFQPGRTMRKSVEPGRYTGRWKALDESEQASRVWQECAGPDWT